jgi:UDP-glucose 4-epimerase
MIGTHLCHALVQHGHTVLVLDTQDPENPIEGVAYTRGDVRTRSALAPLVYRMDGIFHLAAVVGFANVMAQMRETIATNTEGTANVLHYAQLCHVPVLLTSTSACYGRATNSAPVREDQDGILGPTYKTSWSYAYAKAVDEALTFAYHQEYGLPVCVTRLFNTVGPGQSAEAGFVLPRFVRAAAENLPLEVHHPGTQLRTFAHVTDVVRMLMGLMDQIHSSANGQLVNVGGTARVTMLDLAHRVVDMLHSTSEVRLIDAPYGPGYDNVTDRKPDLTKVQALTGMVPALTLDDMIRDVALHEMAMT